MKINVMAIIGLVLIVGFVVAGYFMNFGQAWIIQVVGASVGLAMVVGSAVEKQPIGSKWKAYLIGIGIAAGTMLATFGGINESIIVSIVGAVILVATVVIGIINGQKD